MGVTLGSGWVGEEGVAEDCNSLAHKMQSNLRHSQEVMECSDDGGVALGSDQVEEEGN